MFTYLITGKKYVVAALTIDEETGTLTSYLRIKFGFTHSNPLFWIWPKHPPYNQTASDAKFFFCNQGFTKQKTVKIIKESFPDHSRLHRADESKDEISTHFHMQATNISSTELLQNFLENLLDCPEGEEITKLYGKEFISQEIADDVIEKYTQYRKTEVLNDFYASNNPEYTPTNFPTVKEHICLISPESPQCGSFSSNILPSSIRSITGHAGIIGITSTVIGAIGLYYLCRHYRAPTKTSAKTQSHPILPRSR